MAASIRQMKAFSTENEYLLNKSCRLDILEVVVSHGCGSCILTAGERREVTIDLDALATKSPTALQRIHDIIAQRREMLDQPAR